MDVSEADAWWGRALEELTPGVRRDLLRVLTSPSNVRADAIRQFHERGGEGLGEVLTDLEADELMRWLVVEMLRAMEESR